MRLLRDELELRRKAEIIEIEERKNNHIQELMKKHEKAFGDIKNYCAPPAPGRALARAPPPHAVPPRVAELPMRKRRRQRHHAQQPGPDPITQGGSVGHEEEGDHEREADVRDRAGTACTDALHGALAWRPARRSPGRKTRSSRSL